MEGQNILVTISGKKNRVRVYYLSWLKSKILRTDNAIERRAGWINVGDLQVCRKFINSALYPFKFWTNSFLFSWIISLLDISFTVMLSVRFLSLFDISWNLLGLTNTTTLFFEIYRIVTYMNWFNMALHSLFQGAVVITYFRFECLLFPMNWCNMVFHVVF